MTNIFISTFNCAKLPQGTFSEHIRAKLPSIDKNKKSNGGVPDLFIFGFQELVSVYDSTIDGPAELQLSEYKDELQKVLNSVYRVAGDDNEDAYRLVKLDAFGAVGLIVLVKAGLFPQVSSVITKHTSFGYLYTSLKSSVLISFKLGNVRYSFISAHLNANEGIANYERRNADYWEILKNSSLAETTSGGVGSSVLSESGHVFILGDLNYRAFKNVANSTGEGENESEGLLVDEHVDELTKAIATSAAFVGFKEASINFKPSYKYHLNTNDYNVKRIPSWCDRILYRNYDNDDDVDVVKYDVVQDLKTSDHKPVFLNLKLKSGAVPSVRVNNGVSLVDEYFWLRQRVGGVGNQGIRVGWLVGGTTNGRIAVALVFVLWVASYLY